MKVVFCKNLWEIFDTYPTKKYEEKMICMFS